MATYRIAKRTAKVISVQPKCDICKSFNCKGLAEVYIDISKDNTSIDREEPLDKEIRKLIDNLNPQISSCESKKKIEEGSTPEGNS